MFASNTTADANNNDNADTSASPVSLSPASVQFALQTFQTHGLRAQTMLTDAQNEARILGTFASPTITSQQKLPIGTPLITPITIDGNNSVESSGEKRKRRVASINHRSKPKPKRSDDTDTDTAVIKAGKPAVTSAAATGSVEAAAADAESDEPTRQIICNYNQQADKWWNMKTTSVLHFMKFHAGWTAYKSIIDMLTQEYRSADIKGKNRIVRMALGMLADEEINVVVMASNTVIERNATEDEIIKMIKTSLQNKRPNRAKNQRAKNQRA
eukprot:scaffold33537_cov89-Skeletonema_dohrnii-CCMP3373.AAC.1